MKIAAIFFLLASWTVAVFQSPPLPVPTFLPAIVRTNTYHLTVVLPDSNPAVVYWSASGQTFTQAMRATNVVIISNLTAMPARIVCASIGTNGVESDYSPDAFLGTIRQWWAERATNVSGPWQRVTTNIEINPVDASVFVRTGYSNFVASSLLKPD